VLAATLHSNELVRHVQRYFGDLVKETEAVKKVLNETVAHPEELKRIMESDADLAEWVKLLGSIDDAVKLIKRIKKHVLSFYEQYPALCEVCMSDKKDRKKSQKRSKKRGKRA
jgi:Mg2+ and Co2+ transporter CorA